MLQGIETGIISELSNGDFSRFRLEKTCQEFESIFLTHMLKTMRSAMAEEGYLGTSHERNMMHTLLDESLARGASQGGGIGIGRVLYEKLMAGQGQDP
jgi:Rod binding domain-containing protein